LVKLTPRIQEKIVVPLNRIKEGVSEYNFRTKLSDPEVFSGCIFSENIFVSLKITAGRGEYLCEFQASATGTFVCDRCLEEYKREIAVSSAVLFTFDHDNEDFESESVHILDRSSTEIDISSDVIDMLLIEVPVKKLCREDCKGLCPLCGVNLNKEKCSCPTDVIDPRWEGLKNINFSE